MGEGRGIYSVAMFQAIRNMHGDMAVSGSEKRPRRAGVFSFSRSQFNPWKFTASNKKAPDTVKQACIGGFLF